MPEFPIVDTHVHFWDGGINHLSWNKGAPAIDRPFMPQDLDTDRGEVALDAIVVVEADVDEGLYLKEASWLAQLAEVDDRIAAIVAHAPLQFGAAVGSELEKLASHGLVRGVRRLIQGRDAVALCGDAGFREAVRMLPRFDLHFELGATHDQLEPVVDLVRACPEVRFVLDHMGKPGIEAGLTEPWSTRIGDLAELDNVVCKVSCVDNVAVDAAWTEDQLRPYVDHVLDAFGPGRVLFGSNWPVLRLSMGYEGWVEVVDHAVAGWSAEDRRAFFVENAKRVYRI